MYAAGKFCCVEETLNKEEKYLTFIIVSDTLLKIKRVERNKYE